MEATKTLNRRTPHVFESAVRKIKHEHSLVVLVLTTLALNSNLARSAEPTPTAAGQGCRPCFDDKRHARPVSI